MLSWTVDDDDEEMVEEYNVRLAEILSILEKGLHCLFIYLP